MKVRLVALLAVTSALLVACQDDDKGSPPATPNPPTQPASSAQQPVNGLEQLKACDLLTDDESATISNGLEQVDEGNLGGSSSACGWNSKVDLGVPREEAITFGLLIRPTQNLDDLRPLEGGQVTDGDVSGRPAKQIAGDGGIEGSCILGISVGDGRVDISVERTNQPTDKACDDASKVSTLIEPKLPK